MIPVVVESPFAGDQNRNLMYTRAAMADCLARDEAPFASHALYTQPTVLDDNVPEERKKGIQAGFEWGHFAHKTVVYIDLGVSNGMKAGIEEALKKNRPVEFRSLGVEWSIKAKDSETQSSLEYLSQFSNAYRLPKEDERRSQAL